MALKNRLFQRHLNPCGQCGSDPCGPFRTLRSYVDALADTLSNGDVVGRAPDACSHDFRHPVASKIPQTVASSFGTGLHEDSTPKGDNYRLSKLKAKVAALFTGFITDPDGTAGGLSGSNTNGALTLGMEPGSLIPLPPGTDIRQAAEAIYADPSSLPEAMVAPFRERIAVGDYAGALGYGLPEVLASAAALGRVRRRAETLPAPEVLTLERLRTDPDFSGMANAGPYTPTFERWIEGGGTVELMPVGHFRYAAEIDLFGQKQRVSVEYPGGYPDFRPFMTHPSGIRSVEIDVAGINQTDVKAANIAAGHAEWGRRAPAEWTWHHVEDARTMQLIPREINLTFNHLGGASKARNQ